MIIALATLLLLSIPALAVEDTITVYNWGQYISDGTDGYLDVIEEFTAETGIKVNYLTFDSNETMYTKLKTGGANYDVIIPSDYMIGRLIDEDMLEPLDFANIPNYDLVDDAFKNTAYDPDNTYSVPYTWGTVGLIYNGAKITEELDSWTALWDKASLGQILMFGNSRDAFGIAELILGYSISTTDSEELKAAAELLKEQKPYVQEYVMDEIFAKMERGEAIMAPYYAGDYLMMVQENPDLKFVLPKEGFNMFIDGMCIPKGAANKAGAEAFINFLCEPEISGQNLEYLGYSTPITAARDFMDPEVANSPVAYPSEEVLARGSSFLNLTTEANQEMEALWLEVRTSEEVGDTNFPWWITIALVVVVAVVAVIALGQKKKKKSRRGRNA